MRKIGAFATAAVLLAFGLGFSSASFAQPGMRYPTHHYNRMYNLQTVETLSGDVVSIDTITPSRGMSQGVHLTLKTPQGTIPVHLGPAWYIQNQGIEIKPGDKIEVQGSKISLAGQPAIVAASVKKGKQILTLRDQNGFPRWSGWRHFH